MYKLSYEDISGMGLKPENVHIHGFGGAELDENYYNRTADDLPEVPVWVNQGNDGVFSSGDYILFYAEGPVSWKYSNNFYHHEQNRFSSASYYFITSNDEPLKSVALKNERSDSTGFIEISIFDDYTYFEEEEVNLVKSGQDWFGELMTPGKTLSFNTKFKNRVKNESVNIKFKGVNQSYTRSGSFVLSVGDEKLSSISIKSTRISETAEEAFTNIPNTISKILTAIDDNIKIDIQYNINESSAKGWIDYLTINAKRNLILEENQMGFRSKESIGKLSRYRIQSIFSNIVVLDVTNQQDVYQIPLTKENGEFSFIDTSYYNQNQFVAFNPNGSIKKPEIIGEVANQNLHGSDPCDMLIVVREKLKEQAERLANLHRSIDSMRVLVVTPDLIYNEFSSGRPDVTAIRYFAKMLRDKFSNEDDQIKYLLLFGDGSYDNREENMKKNSTFLLTYESVESLKKSVTHVTDDYYGLLDNNEGDESYEKTQYSFPHVVDIGVGRLPVTTLSQAKAVVDKIESYMNMSSAEDWLNRVCFIGDDEDSNIHMKDAEVFATVVDTKHPEFIIEKVYLDAYQQEVGTSGASYPGAVADIEELLHSGVLLISYSGHGGYNGLAHERIITSSMIEKWENLDKLPLFITATCDFSPYDHEDVTSAGELVLLNPNGGGIASITTTRLVYASQNRALGKKLYSYLFEQNNGKAYRLGDVFCLAKQSSSTGANGRKFALLGDPALMLKYPKKKNIEVTSISNEDGTVIATLRALEYITVKGQVTDATGNIDTTANGIIYPNLFDKAVRKQTLSNDGDDIFNFTSYDNILYNGKTEVKNGRFKYSFYMPKDINYSYGKSRLYHYFDGNSYTSHKLDSAIVIGGLTETEILDNDGPDVKVYLNNESFVSGDIVNQKSYFIADLNDKLGINTSGIGIGHDLNLIIDEDPYMLYNLNDYYQANLGSSSDGSISFQLPILDEGEHKLSFKAWDINNNSTIKELYFVVEDNVTPAIITTVAYPNPVFGDSQKLTFKVEHDRPNDVVSYKLEVFDFKGEIVYSDSDKTLSTRGELSISYNVKNSSGTKLQQGVYLYRIILSARGLESAVAAGRIMVMP